MMVSGLYQFIYGVLMIFLFFFRFLLILMNMQINDIYVIIYIYGHELKGMCLNCNFYQV